MSLNDSLTLGSTIGSIRSMLGAVAGSAAQTRGTLADVQAIPNLRWLFSPETGFCSDAAATTLQTADGGGVMAWKDAGPNHDHATTSTAGLTLSQGAAGGADALNINGSSVRLVTTGTFDSSFDTGFTTFVVASNPTLSTLQTIVASGDQRFYQCRDGSQQTFGPQLSAGSFTPPGIPVDVASNANGAVLPGTMSECFRYNGSNIAMDFIYHGYTAQQTAPVSAPAISGALNIGGLASGSYSWGGKITAFICFNRNLTDSEIAVVMNYLSKFSLSRTKPLVQCIGNSLTAGTNSSTGVGYVPNTSTAGYARNGGKDWPSQLMDLYNQGDVMVRTDAYPGRTDQQIAAEVTRTTMAQYDPAANDKRIALLWEITNDLKTNLAANTTAINNGTTPPAYTNYVNNAKTLRNQGWIVGAFTLMPRGDAGPTFYSAYQVINRLIRANWQTFAGFIVDVASDPRLGAPGVELNTTYFSTDKVHLTDEGYRIVALMAREALDKIIGAPTPARTVLTKSVAGGANVTLTPVEYGTTILPGGRGVIVLTGALTANIRVILPLIEGAQALFHNATTGAYTVTLAGTTGTGYAITQGKRATAYTDGTNWYQGSPEV